MKILILAFLYSLILMNSAFADCNIFGESVVCTGGAVVTVVNK